MTNFNEEDRKWFYDELQKGGYDTGSYDDFKKSMNDDTDRDWYYNELKNNGYDVGTPDEFKAMVYEAPAPIQESPASAESVETPAGETPTADATGTVTTQGTAPTQPTWRDEELEVIDEAGNAQKMTKGTLFDSEAAAWQKNYDQKMASGKLEEGQKTVFDDMYTRLQYMGLASDDALRMANTIGMHQVNQQVQQTVTGILDEASRSTDPTAAIEGLWANRQFQENLMRSIQTMGYDYNEYVQQILKPAIRKGAFERFGNQDMMLELNNLPTNWGMVQNTVNLTEAEGLVESHLQPYMQDIFNKFDTAKQESLGDNVMTNGAVYPASTDKKAQIWETDPQKLLDAVNDDAEVIINQMVEDPAFISEMENLARVAHMDPNDYAEAYISTVISSAIQNKFQQMAVARELPKSHLEYIMRGLENSILGMVASRMTMSKMRREFRQMAAAQQSYLNENGEEVQAGMIDNALQMATTMAGDFWLWGGWGKVGGKVAESLLLERLTATAIKNRVSLAVARQMMIEEAEQSLGKRIASKILQHMPASMITMGGAEGTTAVFEGIRDEKNAGDIITDAGKRAVGGAVTGAAFGLTGPIAQEGFKTLSPAMAKWAGGLAEKLGLSEAQAVTLQSKVAPVFNLLGKAGAYEVEAGTMYTTEELQKMANGEEGFENPFEGLIEANAKLGLGVKLPNAVTSGRFVHAITHPVDAVKSLFASAENGNILTRDDVASLMEGKTGIDLVDALSEMRPSDEKYDGERYGERYESWEKESLQRAAEAYDAYMADPEIPWDRKVRVARVLGGKALDFPKAEASYKRDGLTIKTYDEDGMCVEELTFTDKAEADAWEERNKNYFLAKEMMRAEASHENENPGEEIAESVETPTVEVVAAADATGTGAEPTEREVKAQERAKVVRGSSADAMQLQAEAIENAMRIKTVFADVEDPASKAARDIMSAIDNGKSEAEVDELFAFHQSRLTDEQRALLEQYRDIKDTEDAVDAAIYDEVEQEAQVRRQALEGCTVEGRPDTLIPLTLNGGKVVYYKKGDLGNEWGQIIVVEQDGSNPHFIPRQNIAEIGEEASLSADIDAFRQNLVDQKKAEYNARLSGQMLEPGQKVQFEESGVLFDATVGGVLPDGQIMLTLGDGSPLQMAGPELSDAIMRAASLRVQKTIAEEGAARRQAEAERKAQEALERRQKGIVGFTEGQVDWSNPQNDPVATAEYMNELMEGKDRKASLDKMQKSIDAEVQRAKRAEFDIQRQKQWMEANGDMYSPDELQGKLQVIQRLENEIAEAQGRAQMWAKVRDAYMTPEEKAELVGKRREVTLSAIDEARKSAPVMAVERESIPTKEQLLDQYETEAEASMAINQRRRALQKEGTETVTKELNDLQARMREYENGMREIPADELKAMAHRIVQLEQMEDILVKESNELKRLDSRLSQIYKERNDAMLDAHDKGLLKAEKATNPQKKVEALREAYADDEMAQQVFDDSNMEPRDIEEYVASMLRPRSLNWESVQQEVYPRVTRRIGRDSESQRIGAYLANKGEGVSINEIAHEMWEASPDIDGESIYSSIDIRNTLIDMLINAESSKSISEMILRNRMKEAEDIYQENLRREQEAAENAEAPFGDKSERIAQALEDAELKSKKNAERVERGKGYVGRSFDSGDSILTVKAVGATGELTVEVKYENGAVERTIGVDEFEGLMSEMFTEKDPIALHDDDMPFKLDNSKLQNKAAERVDKQTKSLIDEFAQASGRRVIFLTDKQFKFLYGVNARGGWAPKLDAIVLNVDRNRGAQALYEVMGHEATHVLARDRRSGEGFEKDRIWNTFQNFVRESMGAEEYDRRFAERKAEYEDAKNTTLPDAYIHEEICGDWAAENIFTDADSVRELIDRLSQHEEATTIIQKILSLITRMQERMKALVKSGNATYAQYQALSNAKTLWEEMYRYSAAKQHEKLREHDEASGDEVQHMLVTDKDEIKRLDEKEHEELFASVQMKGGKLRAPMGEGLRKTTGGKATRKATSDIVLGGWDRSDENPDMVDENGKITLDKGNGKTVGSVVYAPYNHLSTGMMNDQFSEAWQRPELELARCLAPNDEHGAYTAPGSRRSTGWYDTWNTGPVMKKLPEQEKRRVYLSRWRKPTNLVKPEEIANHIAKKLDTVEGLKMPFNCVTPQVLRELAKLGDYIDAPEQKAGAEARAAYEEWLQNPEGYYEKALAGKEPVPEEWYERPKADASGTVAGEAQQETAGDEIQFMFVGEKGAQNDKTQEGIARMETLGIARDMEQKLARRELAEGEDREEAEKRNRRAIKWATGWERGADGKWRHEEQDLRVKKDEWKSWEQWDGQEDAENGIDDMVLLGQLVDAPELFAMYPEAYDMPVIKKYDMDGRVAGRYNPIENTIYLNKALDRWYDKGADDLNMEAMESTLIHEIQHYIQRKEGFATGGNTKMFEDAYQQTQDLYSTALQEMERIGYDFKTADKSNMLSIMAELPSDRRQWAGMLAWADSLPWKEKTTVMGFLNNSMDEIDRTWEAVGGENAKEAFLHGERGAYTAYKNLAGEVEARNTEKRAYWSDERRRATLAEQTEDVDREDQIFLFDAAGVNKSEEPQFMLDEKEKDEAIKRIDERIAELNRLSEDELLTISNNGNGSEFSNGGLPATESGANRGSSSDAKVHKKFQPSNKLAKNLSEFIAKEGEGGNFKPETFVRDLYKGIGIKDNEFDSKYININNDGEKLRIRLSDHSGNALSIITKGTRADKGYSFVVKYEGMPEEKRNKRFQKKAKRDLYVVEFVYDNPDQERMVNIAKGVFNLLDTGEYLDIAGADEITPTPYAERTMNAEAQKNIPIKDMSSLMEEVERRKNMFDVNTNPTEAQKAAGNYKKGHLKVDGMDVTIENPKGSTRSGKDADGKEWSVEMNYDYGYVRGTEGVDGDHIDMYLGDKANDPDGKVYVVDQINQEDGSFDEHKVMYGFDSLDAAREAYKSQYEDGWKVGTITEVSKEDFKKWIDSSRRKTKPFSEYKAFKGLAGENKPQFMLDKDADKDAFSQIMSEMEKRDKVAGPVTSQNFKRWFGDWEKEPSTASKVVDEDGKPAVVYHGTRKPGFHTFNDDEGAIWVTEDKTHSDVYAKLDGDKQFKMDKYLPKFYKNRRGYDEGIYPLYASVVNPIEVGYIDKVCSDSNGFYDVCKKLDVDPYDLVERCVPEEYRKYVEEYVKEGYDSDAANDHALFSIPYYAVTRSKEFAEIAKSKGYDGIKAEEFNNNAYGTGRPTRVTTWGVFDATQLKSATANNGDFNPNNPDIRFMLDNADTTDAANREAWEKAKYGSANPKGIVLMKDAGGFITFGSDARKVAKELGRETEDGKIRLTMGDYLKIKDKHTDDSFDIKQEHWSDWIDWQHGEADEAWKGGNVLKKNVMPVLQGHPELIREREAIKTAETAEEQIEAIDDYVQALSDMLDGMREDLSVQKGARPALLEAISEVNEMREKVEGAGAPVEAKFGVDAWKPKTQRKTAGNSGKTQQKTTGNKGKRTGQKTQKEWQETAPSDEDLARNIWADPEEMNPNTGEYYDGDNQELARAVKRGETGAIKEAARRMSMYIKYYMGDDGELKPMDEESLKQNQESTILIPLPSHTGKATYTLKLAKELSKLTGIPVANALSSKPYESSYERKARGEKPEIPEFEFSYDYDIQTAVGDAQVVLLIDNVEATGNTMTEAEMAVSAMSSASIVRFPFVKDSSKILKIGEKDVLLSGDEANTVRWQARTLPKATIAKPWESVKTATVHTSNIRRRFPQLHESAKSGDVKDAHALVDEVVDLNKIAQLHSQYPDALVAYPHAEHTAGRNAIPAAFADKFAVAGFDVDGEIVQTNRVYRTDANKFDRLLRRARFAGDVEAGREYILIDDHITSGATMRDMKDYIESKGGKVVAIQALEGSAGATNIALTDELKEQLTTNGVTDEQIRELGISRSVENLTAGEARELLTLSKRGRDFRSKEQQKISSRGNAKTQRRVRKEDAGAEESRAVSARERIEAEKQRFAELFGVGLDELPDEPADGVVTPVGNAQQKTAGNKDQRRSAGNGGNKEQSLRFKQDEVEETAFSDTGRMGKGKQLMLDFPATNEEAKATMQDLRGYLNGDGNEQGKIMLEKMHYIQRGIIDSNPEWRKAILALTEPQWEYYKANVMGAFKEVARIFGEGKKKFEVPDYYSDRDVFQIAQMFVQPWNYEAHDNPEDEKIYLERLRNNPKVKTVYSDQIDPKYFKLPSEQDVQFMLDLGDVERADPFYSNAAKAVEGIRQEKATPEQWLAMITKAGGLKKGEDKWIGLSEWLLNQREHAGNGGKEPAELTLNGEVYKVADIEEMVRGNVERVIQDNDLDAEIIGVKVIGSYMRGEQNADSDLDVLVEYKGGAKEDSMFNVISDEALDVNGVQIDVNPITKGKSGSIEEFVKRNAGFTKKPKTLTKREVMDYIKEHAIKLEEVKYSEETSVADELQSEFAQYKDEYWDEPDEIQDNISPEAYAFDKLFDKHTELDPEDYDMDEDGEVLLLKNEKFINGTRLSYTTRGLENKKEIALTVPTIKPWHENDEIHFGDAGEGRAIGWIRFGDAETGDGSRVLVIDEIQSKRHQDGRKNGYKSEFENEFSKYRAELSKKYGEHFIGMDLAPDEWEKYQRLERENGEQEKTRINAVPDAPFENNWQELAMKRILRYAAENGYDKVAWTTGKQQADRYDLRKQLDAIEYFKNYDGTYFASYILKGRRDGSTVGTNLTEKELADNFGKELAEKIINGEKTREREARSLFGNKSRTLSVLEGDNLKVGGEGMKGFYDQMLPKFMSKYGKKWGAAVGEVELDLPNSADRVMHAVDVTPSMVRDVILEGQPQFMLDGTSPSPSEGGGVEPEGDMMSRIMREVERRKGLTGAEGAGAPADDGKPNPLSRGDARRKPRKKKDENMGQYMERLREWERWHRAEREARENNDPQPLKEMYDKVGQEEFEKAMMQWKADHPEIGDDIDAGAYPRRKPGETPQDYGKRVADYEEKKDVLSTMPNPFEYEAKADEAYHKAYEEWKRKYYGEEKQEIADILLGGEKVEDPDAEIEARVDEDVDAEVGHAVTAKVAQSDTRMAVIERRKNLESRNSADGVWLYDFVKRTDEIAKRMTEENSSGTVVTGKMIREALPDMIEGMYGTEIQMDENGEPVFVQSENMPLDPEHPELKALMKDIKAWYDEFFNAMEDTGLRRDAGYIEEGYVNHIWDREKSDPEAWEKYVENRQRTTSSNMKHREIMTYEEGRALGLVPKYTDVRDIMAEYSKKNNEAIANRQMLIDLSGISVAQYNKDGEVVLQLPLITSKKPDNIVEDNYSVIEHVAGVGTVWGHKAAADNFKVVFEQNEIPKWLGLIDRQASVMKTAELALSGFHMGALSEVFLVQNMISFGPRKAGKAFFKVTNPVAFYDTVFKGENIAMRTPELFKDAAEHLVKLGATDDYAAKDMVAMTERFRNIMRGWWKEGNVAQKGASVAGLPIATMMDWINKGFDRALWNWLHDGYKLESYRLFSQAIRDRAEKEGWSQDQLDRQLDEAGQYVNDMFGGQHWDVLGISPKSLRWMRRGLLSPDWFVSTSRHALAMGGVGSIYGEPAYKKWAKFTKKETGEEPEGVGTPGMVADQKGVGFRVKNALACYGLGVMVFTNLIMNGLNAFFRKWDEDEEKRKADEMRQTNPDYKSPYELAYPDGMKPWDYTMFGNAPGHKTHLFMGPRLDEEKTGTMGKLWNRIGGRYEDGSEMYVRWGKQFRELPEFFMNEKGDFELGAPIVKRMIGKSNPLVGLVVDEIQMATNPSYQDKELIKKHGRSFAMLYKAVQKYMPFGFSGTSSSKEYKGTDFVFPSSKGFSNYKAQEYFKDAYANGDWELFEQTYRACQQNGIDAEKQMKAARSAVEAALKENAVEGVVDVQTAVQAYDEATTLGMKKKLQRMVKGFLSQDEYRAFTLEEARENLEDYLGGDNARELVKVNDKYLMKATGEDIVEDWRLSMQIKNLKVVHDAWNELTGEQKKQFKEDHKEELDEYKKLTGVRGKITKLKKKLDDDPDAMEKIRKERQKAVN